ncbi:MAG TPA: DUF1453 domain-containing protein [Caulobacteraceae bacterium]|jgi:hypothetical protein|nr:DUF1453 domain-containing protein [Caulobacteraceae bacterium]
MPWGGAGQGQYGVLIPIAVAAVIIILRNSRARSLKIERLWVLPAIYAVMLVSTLVEAPPPITAVSLTILAAAFVVGAALGWQRGRLTRVHIHPETHELTSRASPIGMLFIFAILLVRVGARDFLQAQAAALHLPVLAVTDGLIVLAIAMLATQRLEVWLRASRMLAEAQGAVGPPPPSTLVS